LEKSRALWNALKEPANEAQVLSIEGMIYQKKGETGRAAELYQQGLTLFRSAKNSQGEALMLLRLAQLQQQKGEFEGAVALFSQALPLFQQGKDQFNEAMVWWGLGTANDRLGQKKAAREAYAKALPILAELKKVHEQGLVQEDIATDDDALHEPQKAAEENEQAITLLAAAGDPNQANAEMRLGAEREALGDPDASLKAYQAALALYHVAGMTSGEGTADERIAVLRFNAGERQAALDAYLEAVKLFESAGDRAAEAAALAGSTTIYQARGEYQKELQESLKALQLIPPDEKGIARAATLLQVGDSYNALHQNTKALEYLNQALVAYGDSESGKATVYAELGEVYRSMGDQKTALRYANQALAIVQRLHNPTAEAKVLNDVGLVYASMGEMTKAMDAYQRVLQSARERNDIQHQSSVLNNLGGLRQEFGDTREAEKLYEESLALVRRSGDRADEAGALASLAMAYHSLGEEKKALDTLDQALAIRRAMKDQNGEAVTLNNFSIVYSDTGEPQKALDAQRRARTIFHEMADAPNEASALSNLGFIYRGLGENELAAQDFEQALAMQERMAEEYGQAVTLNNLGVIAQLNGDPRKALDYYGRSLELARKVGDRAAQARLQSSIGMAHSDLGDQPAALKDLHQAYAFAVETDDVDSQALVLHNLGAVHDKMGRSAEATNEYLQALVLWRRIGRVGGESTTLYKLAKADRARGELEPALARVNEAIRLSESFRSRISSEELRASYLATVGNFYELKIALLMQLDRAHSGQGFAARALETSERARARSLLDLLSGARIDVRQGADPALLAEERAAEISLNAKAAELTKLLLAHGDATEEARLRQEISSLSADYDRIEAELRVKSPAYAALTQPQPIGPREIQSELVDADTLLLEYSLGDDESFLFAVSDHGLSSYRLAGRAEILQAAQEFHRLVAGNIQDPEGLRRAGLALSAMLLKPALPQLEKKRLVIVCDGKLQGYVPFAALPDVADAGQPLIAEHEVVMEPSFSAVAVMRKQVSGREMPPKQVAVLADPVFAADDQRFATRVRGAAESSPDAQVLGAASRQAGLRTASGIQRLPFTRAEAKNILALSTPQDSLELLDFDASKQATQSAALANYRIVHFATHGFLDADHPELSGLVLSLYDERGESVDGFLRLNEIFNLKLPVELVVLSACDSGQGKLVRSEGLVGLTRGFMYAGAASLVVSLWSVNDAATAELMTHFYQGMLGANHQRPAAALRAAQLSMIGGARSGTYEAKWSHPYYWSAFTVQGEWK
jgi:CHAT domain-containing protein/tetratricopeptide (TPR) repeat protein